MCINVFYFYVLQTVLLSQAVTSLYKICNIPLESDHGLTDLPQVHALHILNSLFSDSILASNLIGHTSHVTVMVIQQFGSPSWGIRNAATRLFSKNKAFYFCIFCSEVLYKLHIHIYNKFLLTAKACYLYLHLYLHHTFQTPHNSNTTQFKHHTIQTPHISNTTQFKHHTIQTPHNSNTTHFKRHTFQTTTHFKHHTFHTPHNSNDHTFQTPHIPSTTHSKHHTFQTPHISNATHFKHLL